MSEPFLTVAYTPLLDPGFPLLDADAPEPFLTVAYTPKLGTAYCPYGEDHTTT
ncbi:hypothetical protein [Cellulosimicrobium funkei]|uniref:hypothetical protein n=1 Tax=Cellulosimicrobium funkei TaxID=264251 RepID=UPI000A816F06|nr:hypothetical protein [Cellulosimicrobium funkei]